MRTVSCKRIVAIVAWGVVGIFRLSYADEMPDFKVHDLRVADVVHRLSCWLQQPICFEEGRWFARRGDSASLAERLKWRRETRSRLLVEGSTLEEVRNSFRAAYSEYVFGQFDGTIVVYPKKNPPLDFVVRNVDLKTVPLKEVFGRRDVLGFQSRRIKTDLEGLPYAWREIAITLSGSSLRARHTLELIRMQVDEEARWELIEVEGSEPEWLLRFRRVGPMHSVDVLRKRLSGTFDGVRMTALIARIERLSGVSISLEEASRVETFTGPAQRESRGQASVHSLDFTAMPLCDVLDLLTKKCPEYSWEFDDQANTVNVYPRRSSKLDWEIGSVNARGKLIRDMLWGKDDPIGLKKHSITVDLGEGGNLNWLDRPVVVLGKNMHIRKALNLLVEQLPFRAKWEHTAGGLSLLRSGYSQFP